MSDPPRRRANSAAQKRPSRPRLRNQLLFVFGILALATGAFYTALVVATQIDHIFFPDSEIHIAGIPNLPGIDNKPNDSASEIGGSRINILVMGLDRRAREGKAPARTDTMFVMTVDPATHTARGLAMPRDLFVSIPTKSGGSFQERINTAYIYGETNGYPGGGAALAKETVEKLLGIKIQYHIIIDFEGFKQVINLLDGIDVTVPSPGVNDPEYSETELLRDFYPCIFPPGSYHMTGSDALCYARVRRNSGDLDRILRQQLIMFAVMDKVTQLHVLSNPGTVLNLWRQYKSAVDTNINDLQIVGFARLAASIDPNQLAFLSLGAATTPFTTAQGAAVLLPSEAGIRMIVDAFLSDNRLLTEAAVIEVQNGTTDGSQAAKAKEYLVSLGIPENSLVAVNAAPVDPHRTEIIDFSGKRYTAERIASWLGVPKDRVRNSTDADAALRSSQADIVVILGSDAKLESALADPSSR